MSSSAPTAARTAAVASTKTTYPLATWTHCAFTMSCYHRRFTTRFVIVALAAVAIAVAPSLTCVEASTVSAARTTALAATQQQQQKSTSSSMAFAKRTKGGPSYLSFLDDVDDNEGDVFNAMGSSNSRRHQGHGNKLMQVQECSVR